MSKKLLDITGERYGLLTAQYRTDMRSGTSYKWVCSCDCGSSACVASNNLRTGHTDNCGCLTKQRRINSAKTHNMSKSAVYKVWVSIKKRCFDSGATGYHIYGGRGISMQPSWINDFVAFYSYVGDKPNKDSSIDRIDNDGDYCEGNLRWATRKSQTRNKGMYSSNTTGVTGVNLVYKGSSWYYIAIWESEGRQRNKVFSINKYGLLPAMANAIQIRQDRMRELRAEEGYSEKHGEIRLKGNND